MPAYSFEALDPAGTKQSGVLEGDSARQVRELLRERGWLPTAVEVAAGAESGDDGQPWYLRRTKKRVDLVVRFGLLHVGGAGEHGLKLA